MFNQEAMPDSKGSEVDPSCLRKLVVECESESGGSGKQKEKKRKRNHSQKSRVCHQFLKALEGIDLKTFGASEVCRIFGQDTFLEIPYEGFSYKVLFKKNVFSKKMLASLVELLDSDQ